jgi:hypothetical protein
VNYEKSGGHKEASLASLNTTLYMPPSGVDRVAKIQVQLQEPHMRELRQRFAAIKKHRKEIRESINSLSASIKSLQ